MSELKQAWEYSFIHSSAIGLGDEEVGPCLTYDKKQAFGVGCIKQREVFIGTQPEATAPAQDLSAAILALPLPTPSWARDHHGENEVYIAQDLRNLLKAAAALASSANALSAGDRVDAELLQKLRDYVDAKSQDYGYGFYRPANPHDFTPDADQCSEDEIAAHKAACEAFDKGEYTHDHSGCIQGGGMHILHAPWGIGSYVMRDEESENLLVALNAAILQSQKGEHDKS